MTPSPVVERTIATTRRVEAIDVSETVNQREWPDGFVWMSTPHTTVALLLGESDEDMLSDYERVAALWFAAFEPFQHHRNDNPNAAAHLVSSFVGTQVILPIVGGRARLGAYQRVILLELDGPRPRTLLMRSLGQSPTGHATPEF